MPFIIGALVIVLVGLGYYVWMQYAPKTAAETPPPVVDNTPPAPAVNTYASTTLGIVVEYPTNFTLQDPYAYTAFEGKPISGVKFNVPSNLTQGTNLAPDSGVSIEQLPRARACTGDIFVTANVKPTMLTEGAITYSVATSSTETDTDRIEEVVYAVNGSSPCVAVRYFVHTTAITASTTGVREFDAPSLVAAFDSIRRSLVVQQTPQQSAPTSTPSIQ